MRLPAAVRLLRPHQWSKNLLVFAPIIFSHQLFDIHLIANSFYAFIALCLAASAGYICNDLIDRESDRKHPTKSKRPLAAKAIDVRGALLLLVLLLVGAAVIGLALPLPFMLATAGYLITTITYSLRLKHIPVIDVIVLAGLYTLRLYAGSLATGIVISQWLLGISLFTFFSIALAKRYSEMLHASVREGYDRRGYVHEDLVMIGQFGVASGYAATLILMLYFNSVQAQQQYASPQYLWLLYPLALFWFTRFWLQIHRGTVHDDPLLFVLKDVTTVAVIISSATILLLSA